MGNNQQIDLENIIDVDKIMKTNTINLNEIMTSILEEDISKIEEKNNETNL